MIELYSEFGEPLKDANDWQEKGSIFIQFSKEDEPENYCEVFISEDETKFYEDKTTPEQYNAVENYIEKAQISIREHISFCRDIEETEDWLMTASRNW